MPKYAYVAFDLGAESGRAMLATLANDKLTLTETHRFPNNLRHLPDGLHWSLTELWGNLLEGLKKTAALARQKKLKLTSLGVDTWGVDYALLGRQGQLLGLPYAYRDDRNPPAMKAAIRKLGSKPIYDATGIQFMPFNTLFQLVAQHKADPQTLVNTAHLLMIPDLLHYFFSGKMVNESTIASTTQMVDPRTGKWNKSLLEKLDIPTAMLGRIVPAGHTVGTLRDRLVRDLGDDSLTGLKVITPGSHDTASAVAAVPLDPKFKGNWAYLSSGTWSLIGAEVDKPVLTDASCKAGFTNERGVGNKIRFLKNIAGLWLVQECRRDLEKKGQSFDYAQLTNLASQSQPMRTLLNPGHAPFASPGDMLAKINAYAKATRQPLPTTPGQYIRACLESLAFAYRATMNAMEELLDLQFNRLHVVGGGGQNKLLNQFAADACNCHVIVGPYEATAAGNALTQAIGARHVRDLAHLRQIVARTYKPESYKPVNAALFNENAARFAKLK